MDGLLAELRAGGPLRVIAVIVPAILVVASFAGWAYRTRQGWAAFGFLLWRLAILAALVYGLYLLPLHWLAIIAVLLLIAIALRIKAL